MFELPDYLAFSSFAKLGKLSVLFVYMWFRELIREPYILMNVGIGSFATPASVYCCSFFERLVCLL